MSKHRKLLKQLAEVEECLSMVLNILGDSSIPLSAAEDALRDVENLKAERAEIISRLSVDNSKRTVL